MGFLDLYFNLAFFLFYFLFTGFFVWKNIKNYMNKQNGSIFDDQVKIWLTFIIPIIFAFGIIINILLSIIILLFKFLIEFYV